MTINIPVPLIVVVGLLASHLFVALVVYVICDKLGQEIKEPDLV